MNAEHSSHIRTVDRTTLKYIINPDNRRRLSFLDPYLGYLNASVPTEK